MRQKILASVGALILLSLLGSTLSLYRITEVKHSLDGINRVSVPLGRLLAQLEKDVEVLRREGERRLGHSHWTDPHWRPQPIPRWIPEVIDGNLERAHELISSKLPWVESANREQWTNWIRETRSSFDQLITQSGRLQTKLLEKDEKAAAAIYPGWLALLQDLSRQVQWGAAEYERSLRQTFSSTENRVGQLKTGLQMVLIVVVSLSLLLLWLGERALRPLSDITKLARDITRRGLRREDKAQLQDLPLNRDDEVSQLGREFYRMATALLEREKTVHAQKERLEEQNRQLRQMGELQERLRRAEHLAAIGRMSAQVAHEVRNPLHSIGLEAELAFELASGSRPALKQSIQSILASVDRLEKITENYLKLSRLSDGKKENIDIGTVLEDVLATYASHCEKQKVQVDWSLRASQLKISGDRDLLEQALGNLLRNSLQALESCDWDEGQNPRIEWSLDLLETGHGSEMIRVSVQDNGPGVPDEIEPRLFSPFVTSKAQGTGLGLSFVKRVVEEHGGSISFQRAENRGARFEIRLPPASEGQTELMTEFITEVPNTPYV